MARRFGLAFASVVLALTTGVSPATTTGPLSVPPYENVRGIGSAALTPPCTSLAEPVPARNPDPATGHIDGSQGVSVANCTLSAESLETTWKIADSPPELVGVPATVTLVILFDAVDVVESGTAVREASYRLKIGEKEWTIASISCDAFGCTNYQNGIDPGPLVLGVNFEETPAVIELQIIRAAKVSDGTGAAGVDVRGTLQAVVIRAAD